MALYELGWTTTATTLNSVPFELRAGADPVYLRELGIFAASAVALSAGLGRPANTVGAGGTLTLGQGVVSDDAAASAGVVLSGQTTAPTAPTNYLRRLGLPAAVGNGVVFSWGDRGLRLKQASSLVLVLLAAGPTLNCYASWEE